MAATEGLSEEAPSMTPEGDTLVLDLRDLLPDSGGEIVIHGAGLGLTVCTGQVVTATGTAEPHVTASGEDVSGYRYYQLEGGITLYCLADASLLLQPDLT